MSKGTFANFDNPKFICLLNGLQSVAIRNHYLRSLRFRSLQFQYPGSDHFKTALFAVALPTQTDFHF